MKKQIAVLTGGSSSERQVSFWSAENVRNLLSDHYDVAVFDVASELDQFIQRRNEFRVAIPVIHGVGGEDGVLQGLLSSLKVSFLFSGVEASVIGMDKWLSKLVAGDVGVSVPSGEVLTSDSVFSGSCVVKPLTGGSTIGVQIVHDIEGFDRIKHEHQKEVYLVEQFVRGREFTVGVVDLDTVTALPVIEIVSKDGFFDFDQKYTDGKMAEEICPAKIDDELRDRLQTMAVRVHKAIGARHLSRSDFILGDDGELYFLEINTIPGLTKNSLIPKAVRVAGLNLEKLFVGWIEELGG